LKNFYTPPLSHCVDCPVVILRVVVLASLNVNYFSSKYIFVTVSSHSERFEVGSLNRKIAVGFDGSDTSTSVHWSLNTGH